MLIVNVVNNLIIVLFQKKHNFLKGILLSVKKRKRIHNIVGKNKCVAQMYIMLCY